MFSLNIMESADLPGIIILYLWSPGEFFTNIGGEGDIHHGGGNSVC